MGLFSFGPFVYHKKNGPKWYLHVKDRGKTRIYYFSKEPADAINSLPKGFEVAVNKNTGMPYLKKKEGGGLLGGFGGGSKGKKKEDIPKEEKEKKS